LSPHELAVLLNLVHAKRSCKETLSRMGMMSFHGNRKCASEIGKKLFWKFWARTGEMLWEQDFWNLGWKHFPHILIYTRHIMEL